MVNYANYIHYILLTWYAFGPTKYSEQLRPHGAESLPLGPESQIMKHWPGCSQLLVGAFSWTSHITFLKAQFPHLLNESGV